MTMLVTFVIVNVSSGLRNLILAPLLSTLLPLLIVITIALFHRT
jgi:hypothetical protein